MQTKLRAARNRVIVKRDDAETVTEGGVILPDNVKNRPDRGTVLSVGRGRLTNDGKEIPVQLNAGDVVLYNKWCGAEVKHDGEEYLILTHDDVLCVLD